MNKFDYPTAASHTYKMYRNDNGKGTDLDSQREKYKEVVKREKDF